MKIVCDGLDLSEAILQVVKATNTKATNPMLEGIKLTAENDTLTLLATDTEIGIEKRIKANVLIEGETVVPGKFFNEFIRKLSSEQIELFVNDENKMIIKYTDSESDIQCLNPKEFPSVQTVDSCEYFEVSQKDFKNIINKTLFAVAVEDSRPILKGCLLEIEENMVTAVALDGHRLALVKKATRSTNKPRTVIVPARTLSEISKILNDNDEIVKVYIQKSYLMVEVDGCKITSRLIDGDFINYKQIMPKEFSTTVTVNKSQFEKALERASLLARNERNNLVKLDIKDNVMTIKSNSEIGNIKENLTIDLKGNDLKIAFNARFFSESLRVVNDEFIKLNLTSSISPCIVNPNEGEEYTFLILPVRML